MIRFTYDFHGLHGRDSPKVAREQANPDKSGLFRKLRELRFDVVGSLVFALCSCKYLLNRRHPHMMGNTDVHVRHVVLLASQLLARWQSV